MTSRFPKISCEQRRVCYISVWWACPVLWDHFLPFRILSKENEYMYVCNSFKIMLKEGVLWQGVHYCVTNLGTKVHIYGNAKLKCSAKYILHLPITHIWQCKIKMQCQIHITSIHYSMGQVSKSSCLNSNGETFKNKSPNTVMKENSSRSRS